MGGSQGNGTRIAAGCWRLAAGAQTLMRRGRSAISSSLELASPIPITPHQYRVRRSVHAPVSTHLSTHLHRGSSPSFWRSGPSPRYTAAVRDNRGVRHVVDAGRASARRATRCSDRLVTAAGIAQRARRDPQRSVPSGSTRLLWTTSNRAALRSLLDRNNRYGLDGRPEQRPRHPVVLREIRPSIRRATGVGESRPTSLDRARANFDATRYVEMWGASPSSRPAPPRHRLGAGDPAPVFDHRFVALAHGTPTSTRAPSATALAAYRSHMFPVAAHRLAALPTATRASSAVHSWAVPSDGPPVHPCSQSHADVSDPSRRSPGYSSRCVRALCVRHGDRRRVPSPSHCDLACSPRLKAPGLV